MLTDIAITKGPSFAVIQRKFICFDVHITKYALVVLRCRRGDDAVAKCKTYFLRALDKERFIQ